ncbi:MAG: SBBP repeat-containing protein, partial [Acidobacteriota bacterium]
ADARVQYYVQGRDTAVYFCADGVVVALSEPRKEEDRIQPAAFERGGELEQRRRWALKLEFVGARPVRPEGVERTAAVVSYFKGRPEDWKTGLPTYASVVYRDLWPGIDLVYEGSQGRLKSNFIVHPGADVRQIGLVWRGPTDARVTDDGALHLETPLGGLSEEPPYTYQEIDGRRMEVAAGYDLAGRSGDGWRYGFRVASYDRTRPLVLDPSMVVYAGYIGGLSTDAAYGIAVDTAGNAYVTGDTWSSEATFPVTVGPDLTYNGDSYDAFVAKVNAAGTALVYAGYIGGSGGDFGASIAVDAAGNAYVTGFTMSSEGTFPVTVGPDPTYNGVWDAFVAKVNAAGTALVYAGYIGGSAEEFGYGIAVDVAGNAYVTGETESAEATFPVAVGPDLTLNGRADAFVAKVNATGTGLVYAGYIGGSDPDGGHGIAVDAAGNAYVTGITYSSEATFPVTVGPDLTYNGDFRDVFVAKVNAAGTALAYAGYIGGSSSDFGYGIAVDAAGNAYVTGFTMSSEGTFPVTVGPDLSFNGYRDAFVAKVNAAGTALVYAGYLGGSGGDYGQAIAVDAAGNAYVTGGTESTEASFPVTVGPDLTHNGTWDAFVAKVNAAGTALVYAGYIGGSHTDWGRAIALDAAGNAYVAGDTASSEATFPVTVGPDLTSNGEKDAFVAKIHGGPLVTLVPPSLSFGNHSVGTTSAPQTVTLTNSGTAPLIISTVTLTGSHPGDFNKTADTCAGATVAPGNTCTMTVTFGPTALGGRSAALTITDNAPDSPQSVPLSGTGIDTTPPTATVVAPNGGEKLYTGSSYRIEWTASDNVGLSFFDVFYSINGGVNFTPVPGCSGVSGAARSCTWAAPGPATSLGRIKVIAHDTGGNTASDISNANHSVLAGAASITVTAPNTALNWGIGSTQQIKWNHNLGTSSFVGIDVSRDGGSTWSMIVAAFKNTGSTSSTYNWVVSGPATSQARIRVSWTSGPASDSGDVNFTV